MGDITLPSVTQNKNDSAIQSFLIGQLVDCVSAGTDGINYIIVYLIIYSLDFKDMRSSK